MNAPTGQSSPHEAGPQSDRFAGDRVAPISGIIYPPLMSGGQAQLLSVHGPIHDLTLTGVIHAMPSLSQPWYLLATSSYALEEDYERTIALRDALARHKLEMVGLLGEISVRIVPNVVAFGVRADPRAWSDLLRRRCSAFVKLRGLSEIETAMRRWLDKLN